MRAPIETKVALPALVTGVLYVVGGSLYAVALAFEWIRPSPEQSAALAGLGAAVVWAVDRLVGYYAPHTPRDLDRERPTPDTPSALPGEPSPQGS